MNHDLRNSKAEIPEWKCERFLLNELDEAEMEAIRRAADQDPELRARLEAIARSNREILREYPPAWMGRRIRERLGGGASVTSRDQRFWLLRGGLVPIGLLAVVALTVIVLPHVIPDGNRTETDLTRLKGPTEQLRVYRKTATGSEQLRDGQLAAEHDLILLQYQTEEQAYGAIVSVDGRGTITTHLPERGNQATKMELRRGHFLDHAYELDDAPNWEMFLFVTASSPFPIDTIVHAIEESLSLVQPDSESRAYAVPPQSIDLPEGLRISKFTLIKEPHHEN